MKLLNLADWYWIVGGDETRLFSSAVGDYVQPDAAAFVAWSTDGSVPSRIGSEAELGEVLADAVVRPARAGVLDPYRDRHARKIIAEAYFKILFQHENRIRAIERQLGLNGSPANLTPAQARAAVKALM